MVKVNKRIGLIQKFWRVLTRCSFVTIYKAFIRTHLDCGGIIFDQAFNYSVHLKIEIVEYDIALVITRNFRGTWKEIY